MTNDKRKALGRGLDALLPGKIPPPTTTAARRDYFVCAIEEVFPSGANPRKQFDEAALGELAESIREHGVLQPLVVRVRDVAEGGGFTLIAGERRWRAAQRAGLKDVPVVVKEASDNLAFELALVENLQRRDLNPIEEAEGYRRLIDEHGYTQEHLARQVSRDRTTVVNTMRLLKLPPSVRELVAEGRLSGGHARALLGLEQAARIEALAAQALEQGWSVRRVEAAVRRAKTEAQATNEAVQTPEAPQKSANVRDLEARLQRALGVPCRVNERAAGVGKLEIDYANLDELDRVLDKLLKP